MATTIDKREVLTTDPIESAKEAGLRYVSDERPGIKRKPAGKGFSYIDPDGKLVYNSSANSPTTSN